MARGFGEMMQALGALLPPEWLAAVAGVLLVVAVPFWLESMRGKQIRGAVRRMVRAEPEAREALIAQVMHLAGTRPRRLVTAVQQAMKYDQRELRDAALAVLVATDRAHADVKQLRAAIDKPPILHRDPLEAVVKIEGLLDQGLRVAAHEHLEAARRRFPGDPELVAVSARVAADAHETHPATESPHTMASDITTRELETLEVVDPEQVSHLATTAKRRAEQRNGSKQVE